MKSLVINPGSTSTKVALYENTELICNKTIRHTKEELDAYPTLMEQLDYRSGMVMDFLAENSEHELDCVVSRGGSLPNAKSGTMKVCDKLVYALKYNPVDGHPASVGPVIADRLAKEKGIPAFICDPASTSEYNAYARVFGVKGIEHENAGHVLNTRAMGIAVAKELNRKFDDMNMIVVHIGGGNSVMLWEKGVLTDSIPTDFGTFSAERCGCIRANHLIDLCKEHGFDTVMSWLWGGGGFVSLLGTNSLVTAENMALEGNEEAIFYMEAMAYHMAKHVASLFPVVNGAVDGVIFTGGGAFWKGLIDEIVKRLEYLSVPIYVRGGEHEMQALAEGGYRVMIGEETAKDYEG